MAEESFPLPGSSFKQLEKIISAYAELKSEAAPAGVATLAGTDATNVSRNNKFLVATGIVEGTLKKRVTPFGERLGRSIQYEQPDRETAAWLEMVDRTEFFQKLVSAVRIRRGMDSTSLVNHIAFSAGAPKNGQMMAGAGAVLEILIRAGALVEQGGVLVVAEPEPKEVSKPELPSAAKVQTWSLAGSRVMSNAAELFGPTRQTKAVPSSDHKVTLQIQVKIACTAEDIETLGPRLRKLLTEIDLPIDSKTSVRIEAQDQEDLSGA